MRRIEWFIGLVGMAAVVGCGTEASEPQLLTRHDTEPRGEHCALGGMAIRAGLDRDGNGVLDDAEIDRTDYLCDVSTTVLVRKDPLAPSLECPAGGLAVRTGIDDDVDGVLDDAEIDQTTRVCNSLELWDHDFTAEDWQDPLKVAALQGARVVTGSLAINTTEPVVLPLLELVTGSLSTGAPAARLALPALRRVAGNLGVATAAAAPELPLLAQVGGGASVGTGASALDLPALAEVGGDLTLNPGTGAIAFDAALQIHGKLLITGDCALIDAPNLGAVDGPLEMYFNARGTLSLPGLGTIGGDFYVRSEVTGLHLDNLTSIGGGIILDTNSSSPQSFSLALPSLQTIGGSIQGFLDHLTSIDLPQLTRLGGKLYLDAMPLTRISMPRVTDIGGDIGLYAMPALVTMDLGSLVTAGRIGIHDAPALTTLSLPALVSAAANGLPADLSSGILIFNTGLAAADWPSLKTVVGDIVLNENPALRSVRLPQLTTAAGLTLVDDPLLTTVTAPRLTGTDPVDVGISYAPVDTLDLGALTTARNIQLDTTALADLSGLRALTSAQYLDLHTNPQLRDLRGLAALRQLGTLEITSNNALASLDGLEQVTEIRGLLTIQFNLALTSVAGLRNVTYVRLGLLVEGNPMLATLDFTNLRSINSSLWIQNMTRLASLSGLDALSSVAGGIVIDGNPNLPQAEIQAFLTRLGH